MRIGEEAIEQDGGFTPNGSECGFAACDAIIARQAAESVVLKQTVHALCRRIFGTSSEKLDPVSSNSCSVLYLCFGALVPNNRDWAVVLV
jgi:hypothetical protein